MIISYNRVQGRMESQGLTCFLVDTNHRTTLNLTRPPL